MDLRSCYLIFIIWMHISQGDNMNFNGGRYGWTGGLQLERLQTDSLECQESFCWKHSTLTKESETWILSTCYGLTGWVQLSLGLQLLLWRTRSSRTREAHLFVDLNILEFGQLIFIECKEWLLLSFGIPNRQTTPITSMGMGKGLLSQIYISK